MPAAYIPSAALLSCGHRIREARIQKGLTQTDLARLIHMTQPSISDYESGQHYPTTETIEKLAQALECSPLDLVVWDASRWHERIEEAFKAGERAAQKDAATPGHMEECPHPENTPLRHWWRRGYTHAFRLIRAQQAEEKLRGKAP